jgi:hypothetical protein
MAGVVRGWVEYDPRDRYKVMPAVCPAADEQRADRPVCFMAYEDGTHRVCPYYTSAASTSNYTDRQHPSGLRQLALKLGARMINCQILCQAQKRNRPPGC